MAKVDILLATFNGEAYLEAQILSILGQSFRDWRLLVHDDGSSDGTIDVIRNWQKIDSRIHLLEDDVKCGGAAANFMHLVKYADAEYVMFCDQDDLWFDNKVEVMVGAIAKRDNSIPQAVYSNAYVWKPYTHGIIGLSTLTYPQTLRQFLFLNSGMQGCAAIFNRAMQKLLVTWQGECAMHDHILHLFAITLGGIEYLSLPLMLYRQHEHNVTGDTAVRLMNWDRLWKKRRIAVVDRKHFNAVESFWKQYSQRLSDNDYRIMEIYLRLPFMGFSKKILKILVYRFQIYNSVLKLIVKILLRPYIY